MRAYIEEAHDDARRRLREAFEDDLSPFNDAATDPAANYPAALHRVTLQGYFGETLGILAVEHWGAHGQTDWIVPAFLFRFHDTEFQHLDVIDQRIAAGIQHDADAEVEIRPGRTGDDGLAFRRDTQNNITDILTLEAKCLRTHRSEKIKDAHQKLAAAPNRPPGVREMIEILRHYDDPEAKAWVEALLRLWRDGCVGAARHDSVAYVCGQCPRRPGHFAWMSAEAPHEAYTVQRSLEAMEFHIHDLDAVIDGLYRTTDAGD
ncbi:MAG: hypothetical protein ACLQBA_24340 [Candidatus Binataceae bacterium]